MKLSLARDVTLTPIDTGAVLLDGRHGRYWQLNASGSAVLRRLLDGEALESAVATEFAAVAVPVAQAQQDVMALVDALSKAKLVEVLP